MEHLIVKIRRFDSGETKKGISLRRCPYETHNIGLVCSAKIRLKYIGGGYHLKLVNLGIPKPF